MSVLVIQWLQKICIREWIYQLTDNIALCSIRLVGYKIVLYGAQAYIAFLITGLLSKLNIARPFNTAIVQLLEKISYAILCVWLVAMLHNIHLIILEKCTDCIVFSYRMNLFLWRA